MPTIKLGNIDKQKFLDWLKASLVSNYTAKNEKGIDYGVQFELYENSKYVGVVRIFSSDKKGTSLDLSAIKSSTASSYLTRLVQQKQSVAGKGHHRLPKGYMLRNEGQINSIKELLERQWEQQVHQVFPQKNEVYTIKVDGCTIKQWTSGRLLIQGKPSTISDEIIKSVDDYLEESELQNFLLLNKKKFKAKDYKKIIDEIKSLKTGIKVSEELYSFLYPNDKIELIDTLKLLTFVKTQEVKLENYVHLVRGMSIVFEGFLIKLFIELGLIDEVQLLDQRELKIGGTLNKVGTAESEFERQFGDLFVKTHPFLGSKLDSYWKEYRNNYLHSSPISTPILDSVWSAESKINEIMDLMEEVLMIFNSKISSTQQYQNIEELSCIGTDEVGKGDYFGPLVVAGVFVSPSSIRKLVTIGVRDSKDVSDSKIFELENAIKKECTFDVVIIGNKRYNELYGEFKNLNKLLAWGHARVLENMLSKTDCKIAIADQFGDEELINNALMAKGRTIKLMQMPKAEKNIAVAAASILARAEFLRRMEEMSNALGVDIPKGSSDQTIVQIAKSIKDKGGIEKLSDVAKLHFKITKKL